MNILIISNPAISSSTLGDATSISNILSISSLMDTLVHGEFDKVLILESGIPNADSLISGLNALFEYHSFINPIEVTLLTREKAQKEVFDNILVKPNCRAIVLESLSFTDIYKYITGNPQEVGESDKATYTSALAVSESKLLSERNVSINLKNLHQTPHQEEKSSAVCINVDINHFNALTSEGLLDTGGIFSLVQFISCPQQGTDTSLSDILKKITGVDYIKSVRETNTIAVYLPTDTSTDNIKRVVSFLATMSDKVLILNSPHPLKGIPLVNILPNNMNSVAEALAHSKDISTKVCLLDTEVGFSPSLELASRIISEYNEHTGLNTKLAGIFKVNSGNTYVKGLSIKELANTILS